MTRANLQSTAMALLLLCSATLARAATDDAPMTNWWSQLWRTADQRGQALLQQGDAAGAAKTFADPQHKAHASLKAGDYASAAQSLTGIDNAEAHYNRGNALAHTGDLSAAIQAYDAALKHNPQHTDARHNRDIVIAALEKQKQQNNKTDSNKKDGDKKDSDQNNGKSDGKPGEQKDDASGSKPGDKSADKQTDKRDQSPNGKPGDKPDNQPTAKLGERPASTPPSSRASAPAMPASTAQDDAAQARRDAESALGKGTQQALAAQRGASGPNQAAAAQQPLTEKQIAQEQWLRAIPDDPGGLLRRKFLIEHMLRQQGQKP